MNLNKFLEVMSLLGYEVISNSQFELEDGGVYTGYRLSIGNVRCYIVPDTNTDDKVSVAVLKNESKRIEIDLIDRGDKSFRRVYNVLSINRGIYKNNVNLVSIYEELNRVYNDNISDGVNEVELHYDGEFITYRGVASEYDVRHVLETVLGEYLLPRNRAIDDGVYYLVKTSEIRNETEVEDIENILKQVKVYLVRADERNRALHLEDILQDVKDEGTYYDTAKSIVMRIYKTPVYEEDRKEHPFGEELKESVDKKDIQRLRRFAEYLTQNKDRYKLRYKVGSIKGIPYHLLLEVKGVRLVMSPTFVINAKGKSGNQVIYNKHSVDKGYDNLKKHINAILTTEGIKSKEDAEIVYTIIKAYMTSNDLRKTVIN